MDWSTVAISALISAIISTGFGLAVVSQSTVLQMRAQAREEAVRELSAVARDLQRQLLRHQDSDSPKPSVSALDETPGWSGLVS